MAEIGHDPGQDGHIVDDDHVTIIDQAEANTFQSFLRVVESNHWATAVCLAKSNLQSQARDSEEEEGDEIWDEPLESKVVVYLRWLDLNQ